MISGMEREYWYDSGDFSVGANLQNHGEYTLYPDEIIIHKEPSFTDFIFLDYDDNEVKPVDPHEAIKSFTNMYWNEVNDES